MTPNHRTAAPSAHVVVDTETTPEPYGPDSRHSLHRLMLGVARSFGWRRGKFSPSQEEVFRDRNALWNWLLPQMSPRRPLWLWAHNLGFDLSALRAWELLETRELALQVEPRSRQGAEGAPGSARPKRGAVVTGDPPTVLVCYNKAGAKLVCVDTMNWLISPLAEIGAWLDLPKLDMPGDEGSDDDWLAYCRRDVDILERAVQGILRWHLQADTGNMRWTLASQSVQAWRHWGDATQVVIHDDLRVKSHERMAYYGGREECYFQGHVVGGQYEGLEGFCHRESGMPLSTAGPVHRLDVASCYPHVMQGRDYPVKFAKELQRPELPELSRWLKGGCAVAEVVVEDRAEPWPQRRDGGEVWWVRGRVVTVLCGPELCRAIKSGAVKACNWALLYLAGRPFDAFVARCLDGRRRAEEAGDRLAAKLWKSLANDLHGKLGQRRHRWATLAGVMAPTPWGEYVERMADGQVRIRRAVAWQAQELTDRGEIESSSPVLAAYVASYAREHLREIRLQAGHRGILYESADSLHATREGIKELTRRGWIDAAVPGKLRLEQVAWEALYRGPKDYRLDEYEVCSGLSKRAVSCPKGLFRQEEFARLDTQLLGDRIEGPVSYERQLARPNHPIRAAVGRDGWVTPIEVRWS